MPLYVLHWGRTQKLSESRIEGNRRLGKTCARGIIMTDTKYSKALFLGQMKDGSVEKRAALMARKLELDKFAAKSAVSVSDRSSALRELNQINRDLNVARPKVGEPAVRSVEKKVETPAYKVEISDFPTRREVEQPKPLAELKPAPEVEAAARSIQENAENIMVQANMTRPEVISLIG